jgi:pyrimidine operon attenuation protein/uracil phosphoribosyltransferase
MPAKKTILDAAGMKRALRRIGHEIIEHNQGLDGLVIIGLRSRGDTLAWRIARYMKEIEGVEVPVGIMDVTLYRDDLMHTSHWPEVQATEIPFAVEGKNVVLVDDVLYTGRSIRAALDGLMDFGRPRTIQLAILVDRGHRELPIRPDYVGKNIPTSRQEEVQVLLEESDGEDVVFLKPIPRRKKK